MRNARKKGQLTSPKRIKGENFWISDNDETSLRSRYSDVEALLVPDETECEPLVVIEELFVRSDRRHDDDTARRKERGQSRAFTT